MILLHNIKTYLRSFLAKRTKNRREQMQLMVYLTFSAMIIVGMPLHFAFGLIGHEEAIFQIVSFCVWVFAVVSLWLYLSRRECLTKTFFLTTVSYQLVESIGIVYIAATALPECMAEHQKLMLINNVLSFLTLLIACMGLAPYAPTVIFSLFALSMGVSHIICPEVVLSRFVLLFFYTMTCMWIYSLLVQRLGRITAREINSHERFQADVEGVFRMSKAEIVSLIQVCRGTSRGGETEDSAVAHFSKETRSNLIAWGGTYKTCNMNRP